jgi:threonine aldolase
MKGFGSDNHAGVHPELLKAMIECNVDHASSYGTDEYSEKALQQFQKMFGACEVFFVFNGTACNVLALQFLMKRHESVLCSMNSHLHHDECGAPEFFAGKLQLLPTTQGKMQLRDLTDALIRKGDQHYSQPRVLSLTQPTELGTCYSLAEIKSIVDWAHSQNLYVHIDGARLTNALIHLKCSFKEMTTDLGVDMISFGGTKNGLMMGEAIVVLNPELLKRAKNELKYIRKQSAQLPSKTRFIASQFNRYFQDELYLQIAQHSTQMAERLYQGLKNISKIEITCERQSNAVFVKIPQDWVKKLRQNYFFYVWDEKTFECRLMMSWDTKESEVDSFINLAQELSRN